MGKARPRKGANSSAVTSDVALAMYRTMFAIRSFEEQVSRLASSGTLPGLIHLSSGQEAVAVGVCTALREDDYITSNHRGHGHCLAKGATFPRMFAELLGRQPGYCRGRGGSMHIADPATGNLGATGIVGGGIPLATGAALAARRRGTGQVAASFFGDGALNQGIFFESLNLAAIWKLPVLYVCENNLYGEFTASEEVTAGDGPVARGKVFGIPSREVDGMDVLAVYDATVEAARLARAGEGPTLLICHTYRFGGHYVGDQQATYRDGSEEEQWRARDPLPRLGRWLADTHGVGAEALARVEEEVRRAVAEGAEFATAAAQPDENDLLQDVYA